MHIETLGLERSMEYGDDYWEAADNILFWVVTGFLPVSLSFYAQIGKSTLAYSWLSTSANHGWFILLSAASNK